MTKKYTVVRLQLKNDSTASFDWDQLIALATQNYNCQGVVEFDLKESQIDAVLGERAYAGVNLPAPERAELEQQGIALDSGLQFFFYQEQHIQHASIFSDYINSNHSNLQVSSQQSDWQDWNQGFRDNFKALQ
ncbi:MAG: hypothetical protein HN623_04375, partial [Bdellovibrionales bacterium]|nr:hypothetical protein [Bdellovibrionales bacterium]